MYMQRRHQKVIRATRMKDNAAKLQLVISVSHVRFNFFVNLEEDVFSRTAKCLSDCLLYCLSYFTDLPAVKKRVER